MKLKDKVAIVTGAGRGIGRAIALAFAGEGADLTVAARTLEEVEETADRIRALGCRALPLKVDISQQADVEMMIERTLAEMGRVDILVNNAGIQGPVGMLVENDVQHWIDTINVNLIGVYLCTRSVLPAMIAQRSGKIINLAGGGAASSRPYLSAYAASKSAVVRLTEVLADELKDCNIQVNAIAPGAQKTKMIEEIIAAGPKAGSKEMADMNALQAREGLQSEKFTQLAIFLASEDSGGLSGRLLSAAWDDWKALGTKWREVQATELFTLRRVVPEK